MATYNVYRDGDKIAERLTETTYTDTDLTPNSTYVYQVSATNEMGESELSDPLEVRTPYSPPTGVNLDKNVLDLETGESGDLVATVIPATADQRVTWHSSDPETASVSNFGVVTAEKAGEATITAESTADSSKKATCAVTVTDPVVPVAGVTVAPSSVSLEVGAAQQLTTTITPANATNKNVTYVSGDPGVATVNTNGLVTAVGAGTVTITVTSAADNTKTATCDVTVTAPEPDPEPDPEEGE